MGEEQVKGELVAMSQPEETFEVGAVLPFHKVNLSLDGLHKAPAIYTTLNSDKEENSDQLFDSLNGGSDTADKYLGRSFIIENVTVMPHIYKDDDGELVKGVRILLHTDEGDIIRTSSIGVLQSLMLMRANGWKPFGNKIRHFAIESVATSGKNRYYRLKRVEEVEFQSRTKRGKK